MRRLRPDGPLARPLVPESLYRTCSYIIEFDFSASCFGVKCIVFTTAEFSRKHSRTLCGPQHTNSVQGFAWCNAFRFCKVHETSRTLKVTCGVRQGQEEVRQRYAVRYTECEQISFDTSRIDTVMSV